MPRILQRDIPRKGLFKRRRVAVVVVPPVEELDLVGPMQVFGAANRLAGKPVYTVEIATNSRDLKVAGEGGLLSFLAQRRFPELKGPFDSLLLVCGVATRNARDAALFAWLRKMAPEVRRIGSVCGGAFLFAEAGLLDGKRATAHWKFGEELAKRYPRVRVESNPLWVKDGNIYTSAGISAGIDLALAWVEEDCGAAVAHEVARELVLFLRRPGGQPQYSVSLAAQASQMKAIQDLQVWIAYVAAVGKEAFDVEMTLSLVDGKILSGKLDNTVDQVFRKCSEEKLEKCGASERHKIKRNIEIALQ